MSTHAPETDLLGSDTTEASIDEIETELEATPDWKNRNTSLRREYTVAAKAKADAETSADHDAAQAAERELNRIGNEFYELNKGLVLAAARRFNAGGGSTPDYIGAAALGLWEAFLRWDPERGAAFSTFSRQYIAGRVQRTVRQVEFTHLTQQEFNLRKRIRQAQGELSLALGRTPTHQEIATAAEVPLEKVTKTLSTLTTSLETPIGDGTSTVMDLIADKAAEPGLTSLDGLDAALDELSNLELWIITARSDMYGGDSQSLVEIADTIGIGREIARRAETRGRLRLAAAQFAHAKGTNPTVEQLAAFTGKPVDHVEEYYSSTYPDLKHRYRRITAAIARAVTVTARSTAAARLDRFGEEFLTISESLAAELGLRHLDGGEPIGTAEAGWSLFEAFLDWDETSGTPFPSHARKHLAAKYGKPARPAEGITADPIDAEMTWTWIRHKTSA